MKKLTVEDAKPEVVLEMYKELEQRFSEAEAVISQCNSPAAIEYARRKRADAEKEKENKQ